MTRFIWATGVTENYLAQPRIRRNLSSFQKHWNEGDKLVFTVGFDAQVEGFDTRYISVEQAEGHNGIYCLQHGAFLHALGDVESDSIICFTDGDIFMQRQFSALERSRNLSMPETAVAIGVNASKHDTLLHEYARLRPSISIEELTRKYPLSYLKCYNSGVVIACKSVWQRIYSEYMALWSDFRGTFSHYAAQQWLINYVIHKLELDIEELPYVIHTHGCYKLPIGARYNDVEEILYYRERPVVFRHHYHS